MAERRMFSKKIIDTDAFLDMPASTQALYFHLGLRADDDGFVANPKKIQRQVGCCDDDMRLLLAKRFVLAFEGSGVIVIKHWRIHNYIQKDRYRKTLYEEEMATLRIKENGAYTDHMDRSEEPAGTLEIPLDTSCIQNVSILDTQDRLGKDRLDKDSIGEDSGSCRQAGPPVHMFCSAALAACNQAYERLIGGINPHVSDCFCDMLQRVDASLVVRAIEVAVENNARSLAYISAIVRRSEAEGIRTADGYNAREAEWRKSKVAKNKSSKSGNPFLVKAGGEQK